MLIQVEIEGQPQQQDVIANIPTAVAAEQEQPNVGEEDYVRLGREELKTEIVRINTELTEGVRFFDLQCQLFTFTECITWRDDRCQVLTLAQLSASESFNQLSQYTKNRFPATVVHQLLEQITLHLVNSLNRPSWYQWFKSVCGSIPVFQPLERSA